MKKLPLSSKVVNRVMNSFTSQFARRGLRAVGVPRMVVPMAVGVVRELNRHIQWGNKAVWSRRLTDAKRMYSEFLDWQREVSPVYRFRGGSSTVRPHLSNETVRDKYRDPSIGLKSSGKSKKFDSSTVIVGGLGFVVLVSMAGPWLAKKVNYVDPLDMRESSMRGDINTSFDLKF